MTRTTFASRNRQRIQASVCIGFLACELACRAPAPAQTPEHGLGGTPALDEILDASELPAELARPLPDDPLQVTVHRLDNGLTVYLSPNPGQARISAWIAVRAGSRHDPPHSTGLAHYLEHMLFKGTDELGTLDAAAEAEHIEHIAELYRQLAAVPADRADAARERSRILAAIDAATQRAARHAIPNEFDRLYAELGITEVNAFTGHEQTVYTADIPRNRLAAWARTEAERFRDPVFRLFWPELESVYEEKNSALDDPEERVFDSLFRGLFPAHPYGTQATLGSIEHLKTPAYADMVAFYRRHYVPNNTAIVLAGDIDAATALPIVRRYFGNWQARPLVRPAPMTIAPVTERRQIDIRASGESAVYLGWQTVPADHPDAPVIEVLDLLMDNATTGLINVELVLSQTLPSAGSMPRFLREAGVWIMYGVAREGQSLERVEELLLDVVERLRRGDFTQADLDAIALHAEMDAMLTRESNSERVAALADAFISRVPWTRAASHIDRLRAVTRERVIAAANRYLGRSNPVVVRRRSGEHEPPRLAKPKITPVPIDPARTSAFARSVAAMPAPRLTPTWLREGRDYRRHELASGPMIAVENRRNQLFELSYHFELGMRSEPLACFALDLMEQSGQGSLTPAALRRALYATGTTVSVACDRDRIAISLTGIDRHLAASVTAVRAWLTGANLAESTRKKLADNRISERRDEMDDPESIAGALNGFAARGAASQYLAEPSNRALRESSVPSLAAFLARLPEYEHTTLYYGPRPASAVAPDALLGPGRRPLARRPDEHFRPLTESRVFFAHRPMAQAQIALFIPVAPLPYHTRAAAELYNQYLSGGMGALIFQEMREARALAYSVWAGFAHGTRPTDQAALMGFIDTQPDKAVEAIATMLRLIRAPGIDKERLDTARQAWLAEYRATRIKARDIGAQVFEWREAGIATDPRPEYAAAVRSMSASDLQRFARHFAARPVIVSVLGDRTRIDMQALTQIAPVEEVSLSQIFSY